MKIRCVTWNIRRCIGLDGRWDPSRTLQVLRNLDADVIALQELETGVGNALLDQFARGTGMRSIAGPTMLKQRGDYGNALLTRLPVNDINRIDLSVGRREPRGAIAVNVAVAGSQSLEVVTTHFGLFPGERREQVRRLLEALPPIEEEGPGVLLGDFNEWFLWGRPLRWLRARYGATPHIPTFPSRWPLFSLDRIWVRPRESLVEVRAVHDETARLASDHLPLGAVIDLDAGRRKYLHPRL